MFLHSKFANTPLRKNFCPLPVGAVGGPQVVCLHDTLEISVRDRNLAPHRNNGWVLFVKFEVKRERVVRIVPLFQCRSHALLGQGEVLFGRVVKRHREVIKQQQNSYNKRKNRTQAIHLREKGYEKLVSLEIAQVKTLANVTPI